MGLLTENMRGDPFMIRFMQKAGEFFRKTKDNWLIDVSFGVTVDFWVTVFTVDTVDMVEEYMSQLPNNVVPRTNSSGEKLREKQLLVQLPRQDLSVAYCRHLTTQTERKVYEEFVNARNEIALDIGYVSSNINKAMECHKCSGILETNEMAVIAPKLGDSTGWHPACFTCQTCEQLLVDLTYCVKDNQIYCERHYAELHKPRCSACDEIMR
ncbi:hypothetical protein B9Z55_000344 [Caenorhabditis nigoni]|uniref:LIM zinc-binding domain-containing protein n=1 Tax=Caenorhabditis nigoni TaxID=1611254 RepID=A0A2G5VQM8_9PELO|nr:hypothetical protein B9Z55_000344 [Caenorhabditis nigoni]